MQGIFEWFRLHEEPGFDPYLSRILRKNNHHRTEAVEYNLKQDLDIIKGFLLQGVFHYVFVVLLA